jgi:hypothetical protein
MTTYAHLDSVIVGKLNLVKENKKVIEAKEGHNSNKIMARNMGQKKTKVKKLSSHGQRHTQIFH